MQTCRLVGIRAVDTVEQRHANPFHGVQPAPDKADGNGHADAPRRVCKEVEQEKTVRYGHQESGKQDQAGGHYLYRLSRGVHHYQREQYLDGTDNGDGRAEEGVRAGR